MKFDLDLQNITAGSVIQQSECERILNLKREDDKYSYQFLLMQLADYVMKLLWQQGKKWTVKTMTGEIMILTDEEASLYNTRRFQSKIDGMRKCHKRLIAVDAGQLNDEMRLDHRNAIVKTSRQLMALKESSRDVVPIPTVRTIPAIVGVKNRPSRRVTTDSQTS